MLNSSHSNHSYAVTALWCFSNRIKKSRLAVNFYLIFKTLKFRFCLKFSINKRKIYEKITNNLSFEKLWFLFQKIRKQNAQFLRAIRRISIQKLSKFSLINQVLQHPALWLNSTFFFNLTLKLFRFQFES